MKGTLRTLVFTMILGGSIANASADAEITNVTAGGPGKLSAFSETIVSGLPSQVKVWETLSSTGDIALEFTVEHSSHFLTPYDIEIYKTNGTTSAITALHFMIFARHDVVFSSFDEKDKFGPSISPDFTLALPSEHQSSPFQQTGPRDLNFTGELEAGQMAHAHFGLYLPDPGLGQSYMVTVTQSVPEPETYAMFLAGLGIIGAMVRRRKQT